MTLIPNFILITLDSCRWDTYKLARTPNLDRFFSFKQAYTQGTYTYPSHLSMFQGMFPSTRCTTPYYNRFKEPIIRINQRNSSVKALINFPSGTHDIFSGFLDSGKRTFGIGAMSWFKHAQLQDYFETFYYTGTHLEAQLNHVSDIICNHKDYALLLNIGETHEPYGYGGKISPSLESRARVRSFEQGLYSIEEHYKQVKALEYIDFKLFELLAKLEESKSPTVVVCCSDHGDCFGEDNLWGHGFYHPKVMEVPLAIRILNI